MSRFITGMETSRYRFLGASTSRARCWSITKNGHFVGIADFERAMTRGDVLSLLQEEAGKADYTLEAVRHVDAQRSSPK